VAAETLPELILAATQADLLTWQGCSSNYSLQCFKAVVNEAAGIGIYYQRLLPWGATLAVSKRHRDGGSFYAPFEFSSHCTYRYKSNYFDGLLYVDAAAVQKELTPLIKASVLRQQNADSLAANKEAQAKSDALFFEVKELLEAMLASQAQSTGRPS
jgi:hypothetical protein